MKAGVHNVRHSVHNVRNGGHIADIPLDMLFLITDYVVGPSVHNIMSSDMAFIIMSNIGQLHNHYPVDNSVRKHVFHPCQPFLKLDWCQEKFPLKSPCRPTAPYL